MIIKASQRGGARHLANYLLNADNNEQVNVHEVSGFVSGTLPGALQEAYAISRGTRCKQFLFSVSLSPPPDEKVPVETFEEAVKRIETKLGLEGQPRLIVFHEKNARRHAHVVWSRIDPDTMTAKNLSFFKNKLMEISKAIYLEQNWRLPDGFVNYENRNPLNFTRNQWEQAKRLGDDPRQIIIALKECWSISTDKNSFEKSLERNGYYLAQGDRRGFVAVDWRGEVYSLSRYLGIHAKEIKQKLGEEKSLPTVDLTKSLLDQKLVNALRKNLASLDQAYRKKLTPLLNEKSAMTERHQQARVKLTDDQTQRQRHEGQERNQRYRKGLRGLWDRLSGRHEKIRNLNEMEAFLAHKRDSEEKDRLILSQLDERKYLQGGLNSLREEYLEKGSSLKQTILSSIKDGRQNSLEQIFREHSAAQNLDHSQSI